MLRSTLTRRQRNIVGRTEKCERSCQERIVSLLFSKRFKVAVFLVVVCVALLPLVSPFLGSAHAASITYVYDSLGRLVAVVDGSGNAVTYSYDPVGNLLAITPSSGSGVLFFEVDPDNGPVGTQFTIYGDRFSTTPSQNTVAFPGHNATIISSTQTTIVATVPSGLSPLLYNVILTSPSGQTSFAFTVTTN
jgi:YD repeat-containing protein